MKENEDERRGDKDENMYHKEGEEEDDNEDADKSTNDGYEEDSEAEDVEKVVMIKK